MTTPTLIRVIKYFSLLTFLLATAFVALTYFSPSPIITKSIGIYTLLFILSTIILLVIAVAKAIFQKSYRKQFLSSTAWLLLNAAIAFVYFQIFSFLMDTMLVKIINNTGNEATEVYCFGNQWPRLINGESKTVRLNCLYAIEHSVSYKLNGKRRVITIPRMGGIKFTCFLGKEPGITED
jgi:hypothetical protein